MNTDELHRGTSAYLSSPVSIAKYTAVEDLNFVPQWGTHFIAIPVSEVNRPVMNALRYARLLGGRTVAIHILLNSSNRDGLENQWKMHNIDIPLLVLDSWDDSFLEPLTKFVDEILQKHKKSVVTILLPVITGLKWWQRFLHNGTEQLIERAFRDRTGVITIRVPFLLTDCPQNELQSSGKKI
jgi:hypothetical protein